MAAGGWGSESSDESYDDGLVWHVKCEVEGIAQDHLDCYRTAAQMLANAKLGEGVLNFPVENFFRAGMINSIGPRQQIRRKLELDYVCEEEDFDSIKSDYMFRYVLDAITNHGPFGNLYA